MQADSIIEKAKKLGIDTGNSVNQADKLRTIANQLGVEDLAELEETLDRMLQGDKTDQVETLDDTPYEESEYVDNQEQGRFGEAEYNQAKNKDGNYDKNYYANRGKELDEKVESTEQEKSKDWKMKDKNDKGPVKADGSNTTHKSKWDKAKDNANLIKAKNDRFQNKISSAKAKAYNIMHPGEALKDKAKGAASNAARTAGKKIGQSVTKAGVAAGKSIGKGVSTAVSGLVKLVASNPIVLVIIVGVVLVVLLLLLMFGGTSGYNNYIGLYGYDYIEPKCTEITIKNGDYAGVYDIEEYVAGVVAGEFYTGELWYESAKAGAIAARSFVQANASDNCTVESSSNFQNYKTPSEIHIQIANETRGLVLVENGRIKSTQYDAFCTSSPQDDPDNYIICQQNQRIPRSWVDSQEGIKSIWKNGTMSEAHGNGMSAWGAMYLAEQGYIFEEILDFYYDNAELKSIYKSFGYTGEYPIDPNNELYTNLAFLIDESFSEYLSKRGSSVEEFDAFLYDKIEDAGIGTREGVVSAAVSLIGSLADMGIKINYQWGGKYYQLGSNSNWGTTADMSWLCNNYASAGYTKSTCTTNYKWVGFDCSGFVNWALRNGMQDNSITQQYTSTSGGTTLSSSKAVCKPGGVLVSEGHIVLVVDIDDENNRYIVAESTGSRISTGVGGVKLSYYSYGASGYVCKNLDELYGE